MDSTRKERQQKRKLRSQLDGFEQNIIIAVKNGSQNDLVNSGPVDRENIVNINDGTSPTNGITVNV